MALVSVRIPVYKGERFLREVFDGTRALTISKSLGSH
jgi:hypothetical protein